MVRGGLLWRHDSGQARCDSARSGPCAACAAVSSWRSQSSHLSWAVSEDLPHTAQCGGSQCQGRRRCRDSRIAWPSSNKFPAIQRALGRCCVPSGTPRIQASAGSQPLDLSPRAPASSHQVGVGAQIRKHRFPMLSEQAATLRPMSFRGFRSSSGDDQGLQNPSPDRPRSQIAC